LEKDTVINVCPAMAETRITNTAPILPGDTVFFIVDKLDNTVDEAGCYWVIENPYDNKNDTITHDVKTKGGNYNARIAGKDYTITFNYPGGCIGDRKNFNVDEINKYSLKAIQQGTPFINQNRANPVHMIV